MFKWLKKVGIIAVAGAKIAARLGVRASYHSIPLLPIAIEAIGMAEEALGKGKGKLKKETAKLLIKAGIQSYERITGKELVNEDALVKSLDPIIDVLVRAANELELWDRFLPRSK